MFTGLVEKTAPLIELRRHATGARLVLEKPDFADEMAPGDSLALNGCCLTVVEIGDALAFDLLEETLERTNLGSLQPGAAVNLERAMRMEDRLGGHFVQGHVDATTTTTETTWRGDDLYLRFALPPEAGALFVEKGSVAINGVSLTIATLDRDSFGVWIIPHTRLLTNLGSLATGDRVNLEYDMLAKHVVRFLELRSN